MTIQPALILEEADRDERIRAGDIAAFEALFRAEYARLCAFLRWQVGSAARAEELAQDSFLAVWSSRARLRPGGSVRAYLYRSARNAAINERKRDAVEQRWAAEAASWPGGTGAYTDDAVRVRELAEAADQAIASLPERCRLIFDLSRRRGLAYAEIADALEISVKTVETQIGRALKLLRDRLAAHLV